MKRPTASEMTLSDAATSEKCERQNTSVLQGFLTIYDIYIDISDVMTYLPLHERAGQRQNVRNVRNFEGRRTPGQRINAALNRRGRLGDCSPRPMTVNGRSASLDTQAPATPFPNFPTQEVSHRHQIWWGQSKTSRYTTETLQTSLVAPTTKRGSKRNWSLRDSPGTAGWLAPRLLPPTYPRGQHKDTHDELEHQEVPR